MKLYIKTPLKLLFATTLMACLFSSTAFAHSEKEKKNAIKHTTHVVKAFPGDFAWESMGEEELAMDATEFLDQTEDYVKIFDAEDNLIAEGNLNALGLPLSSELQKVMRNATLLMTYQGTHFYRVD